MSVYDRISALILEQLERGTPPWRRTWQGGFRWPRNLTTLRKYHGLNCFLLGASNYDVPLWLTYRQAQALGGNVKRGERATPIIFWTRYEKRDAETGETKESACLKTYAVFNARQCEGIDKHIPPSEVFDERPNNPIAACDRVVREMPNPPAIRTDAHHACYVPAHDEVRMPPIGRFDSAELFHAVLFHEVAHSTGHASRLARAGVVDTVRFGSEVYGVEELTAEMASAFLCGHCGIETATLPNSAAYLDGWLKAIRKDVRMLVAAGAAAQRAADYVLNVAR